MRILIIEDDSRIADFLQRGLNSEGNHCVVANDGDSGLQLAKGGDFDLVLLDLMLPGMHGLEVCQQIRMRKIEVPVIMLTGMDKPDDIIAGLRMGADDYLTKPFLFDELRARIQAVTRRSSNAASQDHILKAGVLEFDRKSLRFSVDGKELDMTAKELALIELLMSSPGTIFSRERILSNVWGINMDPLTNVVEVYIAKLRKKIDAGSDRSLIETVRGLGYRLARA